MLRPTKAPRALPRTLPESKKKLEKMKIREEKVVPIALLSCNGGFKLGFLGEIGVIRFFTAGNLSMFAAAQSPERSPVWRLMTCGVDVASLEFAIRRHIPVAACRLAKQRVAPAEWRSPFSARK